MNKLLKDAIADAKAVRETALANAKLALEEAFAPKLQNMVSAKIREEMDEEEPMGTEDEMMAGQDEETRMKELAGISEEDEDYSEEGGEEDFGGEEGGEDFGGEEDYSDEGGEEDFSDEGGEEDFSDESDEDLEEILRELDAEGSSEEEEMMEGEGEEEEMDLDEIINALREEEGEEEEEEKMDEEIDLNELLNSLNEEEGEEEEKEEKEEMEEGKMKMKKKMNKMEEELNEAYSAVKFLRTKLSEVNLLNAKLLYVNKLFRNNLTEAQKVKIIETFDRAKTVREAKLVFATLSESIKVNVSTKTNSKKSVMEGYASKATKKTNTVLTEGNDIANRFKKLAGII
jgi:hypothetical protein